MCLKFSEKVFNINSTCALSVSMIMDMNEVCSVI